MSELFSQPCALCRDGQHDQCRASTCGCLADHPGDADVIRGFKVLKRQLHPEREADVKGGWRRPPIRVQATIERREEPT